MAQASPPQKTPPQEILKIGGLFLGGRFKAASLLFSKGSYTCVLRERSVEDAFYRTGAERFKERGFGEIFFICAYKEGLDCGSEGGLIRAIKVMT